jgi:hypothetical protein
MMVFGPMVLVSGLSNPEENVVDLVIGFVITVFGMWLTFGVGTGKKS